VMLFVSNGDFEAGLVGIHPYTRNRIAQ